MHFAESSRGRPNKRTTRTQQGSPTKIGYSTIVHPSAQQSTAQTAKELIVLMAD
jgi:hypothetical protein